jgi:hypothetical protein
VHVATWPPTVDVSPGEPATFIVTITNASTMIDAYRSQVFGIDPEWVTVEPARLSLFPHDVENVMVTIALPIDYPAAHRTLAISVRSENDPEEFALDQVQLSVQPISAASVAVDPVMITAGKHAVFGVVVTNEGNAPIRAQAVGTDPEDTAKFVFEPPVVVVPAGRTEVVRATVSGGRSWFGQPRARVLKLGVEADQRVEAIATFIQRPRIGRWMLSLLGLLLAAAVFAGVLSRTFNRVVDEAAVDDDIIENALARDAAGGAGVPVNPATVSGSVVSLSAGTGIAGIQADLFVANDTNEPFATAATDGEGKFNFSRLGAGTYKLRFSGAGFDGVWYGDSPTPADAAEIETQLGEPTPLEPFAIGARPGSVSGTIEADDPGGAVITLTVQGQLDPDTPALVAQVESSADGSFLFEEVPSPAVYQMEVTKPGHAVEQRDIVLGPAEALEGIEITLRPGDGVVSGTVSSTDGPLGGATITATDGTTTIETVSLTEGTVGGFVLRNLATPGRYTLTVSREGYADESRSITLVTAQTVPDFNVTLARAIGSISGRVSVADLGPSGGITVTVTGGDVTIETTSASQGDVGTFQIGELPIPATYTVTFSRDGLLSQVRLVDLDPNTGRIDVASVDATLVQDRAVVRGIVRDVDGQPAARAQVELTDGTKVYRFLTADDPPGRFEFSGVAAGAYTLSAELTGTTPVIVLVNVQASDVEDIELRLGAQASVSGRVLRFDPETSTTGPFQGAVVRLFAPADFPANRDAALQVVTTDPDGNFRFSGLAAPADYIIAVYVSDSAADPLDSALVASQPGEDVAVDPFVVSTSL